MVKKALYIFVFILISFAFSANVVSAASISLTPKGHDVAEAEIFSVDVEVSSTESINAYSGTISYPSGVLEVLNINKDGSIVDFWVQQPSFSNVSGKVKFGGLTLDGFNGEGGHVITIVFRAKKVGEVDIEFIEGSVLANDGNGTETISVMDDTKVSIFEDARDIKVKNINTQSNWVSYLWVGTEGETLVVTIFRYIIIIFLLILFVVILALVYSFIKRSLSRDHDSENSHHPSV